jgi:phosphate starvation-inducible PhoH-like protein
MPRKAGSGSKAVTLSFDDNRVARDLFGAEDRHLRLIEEVLGVETAVRGASLRLSGAIHDVEAAERILRQLYGLLKQGQPVLGAEMERVIRAMSADRAADIESLLSSAIFLPAKRRPIMPRSPAQKGYLEAIASNDMVFCVGPAGTGKTYLAVAMAVASLLRKEFDRIILTRPAVEAGEKLGFLPGDLKQKVNPFIRPLYDALHDMLDVERVEDLMADGVIEIAPIAFMRGRTLHRAFIILDEGQNCSYHQMKMCLTRLGVESRIVVNGDVTQIDLPPGQRSGLLEAWRILDGCPGIAFHRFTEADVVRHRLVGDIVRAYEKDEGSHG